MNFLPLKKAQRRMVYLASIGGALEFYDFLIYIIFGPIISPLFFPNTDPLISLLQFYLIFAAGYLIRPLGGIIFSHFGDLYGRKKTFIASVVLMAVPTLLIGLLPTYQTIGITATISIILLRILQGLSIGGETPCAITFIGEYVKPTQRGVANSIIFVFFNFALILGNAISLLLTTSLSSEALQAWGWRIPFILGGVFGIFGFYLRKKMTESPVFNVFKNVEGKRRVPFFEMITHHWPLLLQGIGVTTLCAIMFNLLYLYLPIYFTKILSYSTKQAEYFHIISLVLYTFSIIIANIAGDKYGRRSVFLVGVSGFLVFGFPIFYFFAQHSLIMLFLSMTMIVFFGGCVMVYPAMLVELFPTSIRFTGVALSYNLAFALFGGMTPFIATYLVKQTDNVLSPAFYLIAGSLCSLIGVWAMRNKQGQPL